jgi:transcription elongation factor Elf1
LAKVALSPFNCPVCGNGTLVQIEVEEDSILKAQRLPAIVTTRCKNNHSLVLFVDGNFQVRDVEAASNAMEEDKDAIDKTRDWFSSL